MWALSPGGELQMRGGHVGDGLVQVVAARGQDPRGLLARQGEDHGDVVGREGPEDVLLAPDLAQIQAVGIDVIDPAQLARGGHVLEPDKGRVVLEQMADHEHEPALLGQGDELLGVGLVQNQGLLHIDVASGQQGLTGQGVVGLGRGGHDHALHRAVLEHLAQGLNGAHARELLPEALKRGLVAVADRAQGPQLVEIAHQVLAPVARADHGHIACLGLSPHASAPCFVQPRNDHGPGQPFPTAGCRM